MKSVIDRDGNFVCTFEGGDINLDDPAFEGCTIIDGDAPLQEIHNAMADEARLKKIEADAERDEEHRHLHSLEDRISHLEGLISSTER